MMLTVTSTAFAENASIPVVHACEGRCSWASRTSFAGLRRFGASETFDEQAIPDLNSEAIDFRVASECFAPVRKLRRQDVRSLRLTTSGRVGMTTAVIAKAVGLSTRAVRTRLRPSRRGRIVPKIHSETPCWGVGDVGKPT